MSHRHRPTPPLPPDVRARLEADGDADLDEAWRLAGLADVAPAPSAQRKADAWRRLSAATQADASRPADGRPAYSRRPPYPRRPAYLGRPARIGLAVTALLFCLVGLGLWRLLGPTTLTAPPDQTLTALLPDGSRVELNGGASLSYARAFGEPFGKTARHVRLEGEAFFDVAHGERPFVVRTFNADVVVLGTRFNVRAHAEGEAGRTSVAVASGRVRVAARADEAVSVTLGPGQQSALAAGEARPVAPQPVAINEVAAWRDEVFRMIDRPLGAIFDQIERRFDVRITAPADVRARRWSVTKHPPMTSEELLREVCVPNALRFRPTSDGFEVYETEGEG